MRAWWSLVASVMLIVGAYIAEQALGDAFAQGRSSFDMAPVLVVETAVRFIVVGLLVALGATILSGPRSRLAGAVMAFVGGYFALVLPLSFFVLTNTGIPLPPFAGADYQSPSNLLVWTATGVTVLGLVVVFWPSATHTREPTSAGHQSILSGRSG